MKLRVWWLGVLSAVTVMMTVVSAPVPAHADGEEQDVGDGEAFVDVAYFRGSGTIDGLVASGQMLTTMFGVRTVGDHRRR